MKKLPLIGMLLALLLPSKAQAQIVIAPQPYINASGVAVGPILAPNGTVALPGYAYALEPATGLVRTGTGTVRLSLNNSDRFQWDTAGFSIGSATAIRFADATTIASAGSYDVWQRRSGNKTFTIDTDGAGGALTSVVIVAPLTLTGSGLTMGNGSALSWAGRTQLWSDADGLVRETNNAGNGFTRHIYGTNDGVTTTGFSFALDGGNNRIQLLTGDGSTGFQGIQNKFTQSTRSALATTSTDGIIAENTTVATNGVPVQISPRNKWCGTAYNSVSTLSETDCFIIEVLPVTVAGATTAALKVGVSVNGGAYSYPLNVTSAAVTNFGGQINVTGGVTATGAFYLQGGQIALSSTAPTIASGGCTSPAITDNNGSASFKVTLGTSCTGVKTFTLTMPAVSHRWSCSAHDLTTPDSFKPDQTAAASTTAVVITNYSRTTGAQIDFVASEVLQLECLGG